MWPAKPNVLTMWPPKEKGADPPVETVKALLASTAESQRGSIGCLLSVPSFRGDRDARWLLSCSFSR